MGKNYTLYVSTAVDEQFAKEKNKSGLINDLLLMHYGRDASSKDKVNQEYDSGKHDLFPKKNTAEQPSAVSITPTDKSPTDYKNHKDLTRAIDLNTEKPCCSKPAPCQHWDWNGDGQVWINTLSGRERTNEQ